MARGTSGLVGTGGGAAWREARAAVGGVVGAAERRPGCQKQDALRQQPRVLALLHEEDHLLAGARRGAGPPLADPRTHGDLPRGGEGGAGGWFNTSMEGARGRFHSLQCSWNAGHGSSIRFSAI